MRTKRYGESESQNVFSGVHQADLKKRQRLALDGPLVWQVFRTCTTKTARLLLKTYPHIVRKSETRGQKPEIGIQKVYIAIDSDF
jgi:hypothetical protein